MIEVSLKLGAQIITVICFISDFYLNFHSSSFCPSCQWVNWWQDTKFGAVSIYRCNLISRGNPNVEIRQSYDRLISTMGFPVLVRWHLYIEYQGLVVSGLTDGKAPTRCQDQVHWPPGWWSFYAGFSTGAKLLTPWGLEMQIYRQVSNIRRTKSHYLKDFPTVLRLSLPNLLKPDVKSRMKM